MPDTGAPVGLNCPGCGQPPMMVFGGGMQAFCETDDCPWFTWNPTKTAEQLLAGVKVIDIQRHDDPEGASDAGCPDSKMDDGRHATDYYDGGHCPWCGTITEAGEQ